MTCYREGWLEDTVVDKIYLGQCPTPKNIEASSD